MEDLSLLSSLGYESDDTGSDVDSESRPILSDRGNISLLQEKIDNHLRRAVVLISRIGNVFVVAVLSTIALYFIDLNLNDWIPIYVLFFVLWLGYLSIFMLVYKITKRVFKAVTVFNESKDIISQAPKGASVDNRVQVVLFILSQVFWIASLSITTLASEVLILLNQYDVVAAYAFTLPLYISVSLSLIYSILNRYCSADSNILFLYCYSR